MATEASNTIENTESKAKKEKDVRNDMDARRILNSTEDAIAYLTACAESYSDFNNYPVAAPGVSVTENGLEFDPDVYTDDSRVMVAVLKNRGETPGASTVKAIVIAPIPTLDAILANPDARDWAARILEKELNHVAVRQLRKAEDIGEVVDSMPKTLADYITSDRGVGGALEAYETLWRAIKTNMGKLSRSWRLANLSKKELRRGLESAAYASEYYPTLEETKKGSLFVFALNGLQAIAKKQGLDPAIFDKWLENRNEKTIDVESEDEEDFSLEDLAAEMEKGNEDSDATEGTESEDATDAGTEDGDEAEDQTDA